MSSNSPDSHTPHSSGSDAIRELLEECVNMLQSYGWYILLVLLVLYLLRPHLHQLRAQASLRLANNPTRRKILDEEKKRVRLQQQINLAQAVEMRTNVAAPHPEKEEAANAKTRADPPVLKKRSVVKRRPDSDSGYNPLQPGGGSSYCPASRASSKGRRQGR